MTGPARAGVFVYAKDVERLAAFYEQLLGLKRVRTTSDLVVLSSPDLQMIVNVMPPHIAAQVQITAPPSRREQAGYKFFYTVPSIAAAAELAASLGGEVVPEQWHGPGFVVRNAVDPEGNIFQVRESVT